MIQVEEHHSPKWLSETHTDTSKELNISSQLKACIPANSSTLARMLRSLLAIFFQSTTCPKEPLFPTVKERWETEDLSPEHQAPQPLSLVIPMMAEKPELDFHQEPERPLSEHAELWLVCVLEDR